MEKIKPYLISADISAREAMKRMDALHAKILFVVINDNQLFGALSDGDLRRWILSDGKLSESVGIIANTKPISFNEGYSIERVKEVMLHHKIQCIPIINYKNEIKELLFWDSIFQGKHILRKKSEITVPIVIMAGGMGTRLEPFTQILPKPLIPIGDKTIIELVIDKFLEYKVNQFYISIGYKSKIIRSYFDELDIDYQIEYIIEDKPLGTIGSLYKISGAIQDDILVTNCDIIIDADYSELVKFHKENNHDITLVGSLMHYKIPYGICEIETGGLLTKFIEKPEYSMLASTGMYVLSKYALEKIPMNEHFHITQLIDIMKFEGRRVGVYPISENSWVDTGEWNEYHKVLKKMGLQ
jgi:dTDP-glucose pyrophosphorylase